MADQGPQFCPWCGRARVDDSNACLHCGGPSIRSVLPQGMGAVPGASCPGEDPISFFGEDIPTLLWNEKGEKGGSYFINPEKLQAKWQWLTGQANNRFPFTLPANQKQKFRVRISPDSGLRGDTEIAAFMLTSTGRVAIEPFIPLLDARLSNGLVPSSLMFGTAQLQALLAQTLYCLPSFDWTFDAQDLSTADNVLSPVFFGRRFTGSQEKRVEAARRAAGMSRFMHPFWLVPTTAFNVTAGTSINPNPTVSIPTLATVTVTYSVPSNAYFDCRWILDDSSTSTGANTEINDLLARIREGGSGNDLVDVPPGGNGLSWRAFIASPVVAVAGFPSGGTNTSSGGIRAASLPSPAGGFSHLFKPGTDIVVTFVSTDTGTITLRTAFVGILIYAGEPLKEECA